MKNIILADESICSFLKKVAMQPSTPAGGSVAALSAASAASLAEMASNLTLHKTEDERLIIVLENISHLCSNYRVKLIDDMDRDSQVFASVLTALKLPGNSEKDCVQREINIQESYKKAVLVPLDMLNSVFELMKVIRTLLLKVNDIYFTDAAQAYMLAEAAFYSLLYHIRTNLIFINDMDFKCIIQHIITEYKSELEFQKSISQ